MKITITDHEKGFSCKIEYIYLGDLFEIAFKTNKFSELIDELLNIHGIIYESERDGKKSIRQKESK